MRPIRTKSSLNAREKPTSTQSATTPTATKPQLSALTTPSAGARGLAHEGRRELVHPGQAESADLGPPVHRRDAGPAHGLRCYLDHGTAGHRARVLYEDRRCWRMERASLRSQSESAGPNGSGGNPSTRWRPDG